MSYFFQEIVAGNTDTPQTSQPSPPCADSNQSYPGDRLGVTKDGISQDSSKTKKPTMQHLLSDWRTAMSSQPKVKQPGSQSMESIERDKKAKTIQHLLCDWRTAYTESKKVILFIFFLYIIQLNLFSGNNCWENKHSQFISPTSIMQQGRSENQFKIPAFKGKIFNFKNDYNHEQVLNDFRRMFIPVKISGRIKQYSIQ